MTLFRKRLRRASVFVTAFGALALLTAGCFPGTQPTGWTASRQERSNVYISFSPGKVSAADASNGNRQWDYPADDKNLNFLYYPPAVASGNLIVGTLNNEVIAVRASDGGEAWKRNVGQPLKGEPLVEGNTVYIGGNDGTLYALDASAGGQPVPGFAFKAKDGVWGKPKLQDGTLYVTSMDHNVYAIDPRSGAVKWSFATNGAIPGSVSIGANIYVSSLDNTLYALDIGTGAVKWTFPTGGWIWSAPLVDGNTLYFGSFDKKVYALDTAGQKKWEFAAGGRVRPAPVIAANLIVFGADDGKIYAMNQNGEQQWVFSAGGPVVSPLTADSDTVYASDNSSHRVIALDARNGAMRWELPVKK